MRCNRPRPATDKSAEPNRKRAKGCSAMSGSTMARPSTRVMSPDASTDRVDSGTPLTNRAPMATSNGGARTLATPTKVPNNSATARPTGPPAPA